MGLIARTTSLLMLKLAPLFKNTGDQGSMTVNENVIGCIEDTTELNQIYFTERLYHSDEFEMLLERSGAVLTNISELERTLEFISIQCGEWFSRWVCSPADQPDEDAQAEFDNWELIWRALVQCRFTDLPKWLETVTFKHITQRDRRLLRHVNKLNKSKPLRKFLTNCCFWTSRYLNSIRLNWAAKPIISCSLYPKGSVGRR